MEPLRNILRRPAHPESRQLQAAHVVAAASTTLQQSLQLTAHDVVATSFAQRRLVVSVAHPAIAGKILQQHDELCRAISATIQQQGGTQEIQRIVARVTELP